MSEAPALAQLLLIRLSPERVHGRLACLVLQHDGPLRELCHLGRLAPLLHYWAPLGLLSEHSLLAVILREYGRLACLKRGKAQLSLLLRGNGLMACGMRSALDGGQVPI